MYANRDRYHDVVRRALQKDEWTITDDPLRMCWDKKDMCTEPLEEILPSDYQVPLLVFGPKQEVIVQ